MSIMAQPERYEALVLGSGEGGTYPAWHLVRSGRRIAVVPVIRERIDPQTHSAYPALDTDLWMRRRTGLSRRLQSGRGLRFTRRHGVGARLSFDGGSAASVPRSRRDTPAGFQSEWP